MRHVSVDIVTGFLGSGKTTLLRHVLGGALAGEKVAVVMNELGDIGIDGRVITGLDHVESMVELNSGCICCTIDDYRFDLAVQELIETARPTLLLIESTGVADPGPMVDRVAQAGLALDAIICVIDAVNFEQTRRDAVVVARQAAAADFIIVNKVDLVSEPELRRLRRRLARLNSRALTVECERGRIETDLMFGTSARRYRTAAAPPSGGDHMHADRMAAFNYRADVELDQARFERFLRRLPRSVLRAKGLVRVAGNPWSCLFHYTCGRYELNWVKLTEGAGSTQAVFIGRDIERARARIERELALCEVS